MPRPDVPATRPADPPRTPVGELVGWARQALAMVEHRGADPVLSGVSLSSQRIRAGDLYAALPGARAHGADFATDALEAGAVAVLTDPAGAERVPAGVPLLVTEDPRRILGRLSARVYGNPAEKLTMIGVTGTQGKTTTTRLLEGGLVEAGLVGAVIGTVGTRVAGRDVVTSLTTPEAPDLHGLFAVMVEQGVDVCAMEVSSHALVLGRVDGVVFDLAVFLNLGRDHLDFHDTVEEYYAAKASLFTPERARRALVNLDDEHGRRLAQETTLPVATFSTTGAPADWGVTEIAASPSRTDFRVLGPAHRAFVAGVPLAGSFNVSNALAAVAAVGESGAGDADPLDVAAQVAAGISGLPGVPGRLESVEAGQDFEIVVDYAHKPDAVEAALGALRPLTAQQLVLVIGAGGDRDTGKRAVMGEIGARLADVIVVTDDNPRTEDPAAIRAAVLEGAGQVPEAARAEVLEVGDRRAAIEAALRRAGTGDIVLVAGKGHESGQEVAGVVHPFDDRLVCAELVRTLGLGAGLVGEASSG
ncbi:UDP-N-acetylmuramoyl-L-alanyl-D-glutamate--2,6-diaminopimelate ligase [Nocardioides dokdonensis FR1436]|uniref:UDP-N-acetylmuramoyl-L-alanyl-D-glutamate--2,6-diaminopimelate ligase n=1 Tax=Nocardioides dokdonensis FR1436 TaxID=1300347 RepID=A0A1A9GNX7_9ACTN|nr:UDP-N-acetylmuramoyl-L-alanyl-D-glutamate--2,6-diaminopimelate ligase [Nocardioides dokdonensis]ANH39145.1 UDP-N-acetylmuramoyl-L-alanyl-D-glutamate--2,6-diaminopimelate ligase [Nocardioides dokdonensis FR1436]